MATVTTPAPVPVQPQQALARDRFTNVRTLLQQAEKSLATALPQGIPVSYMIRVVLTAVQRNPELLECDHITLLGAVFQAAQLGLVPDGVLGQAYLVPFWNSKKDRKEVQFIPGYRGLVTLVRRSGDLSTIDAEVVHAKDQFRYSRGTSPMLEHVPYDGQEDPGPITHVWAAARLKDGSFQIVVMTAREVEKIKARSASVKAKRSSPWDTDREWMFKKTALKQLCKLLPTSVETQRALSLDDRAEVALPQDLGLLASETETATPIDDAEVIEAQAEIQMPQRKGEPPAGIPEPPTPPEPAVNARYIKTVEKMESNGTRGKSEEYVAAHALRRRYFALVVDDLDNVYYAWDDVDARVIQAKEFRDKKVPVEILAKPKDGSGMAEYSELVRL